jgi:hypothetical protein
VKGKFLIKNSYLKMDADGASKRELKMNKIVHCKKEKYDVYIGRPSIFGNPFTIGKDGNRKEVIEKFKIYFHDRIWQDLEFTKKVYKLKNKILGCWCAPQECHGDIIKEYLDGLS